MPKQTANAAVLVHFNQPLQTRTYPLPDHVQPGEALVKTEMAGICGTDVHLWKGELPIHLPTILGHETAGHLALLGEGLDTDWTGNPLAAGDRVTWNAAFSCGHCYYCAIKQQPTRCPERRAYGIAYDSDKPPHFLGGYAEYHALRAGTTLFKLPDNLPTEAVIGAGCALVTAIHGVERICAENRETNEERRQDNPLPALLPEPWQEWVVIQGAGPVGLSALAVAREAGAENTILIGGPKNRLAIAKRFGADHIIDLDELPRPEDRIDQVLQLTGGHGADTVLECVGHPSVIDEGMAMCRDGGKFLVLGHYCDAGPVSFNPHTITRKQLQVFGSWSSLPRHMHAAIHLLEHHRDDYPFHELVTHRFPVDQANEALATTARWESAKTVIVPP